MMRKTRVVGIVLAALPLLACGSDTQKLNEHVSVENAAPMGSVGGIVLDAVTGKPIPADTAEVNVTVVAGDQTLTATADPQTGLFSVSDVPASGPAQVVIDATGYLPAYLTAEFTNEAGEFPVSNAVASIGPVGLIPATGRLRLRILDHTGSPVVGLNPTLKTRVSYLLWQDGAFVSKGWIATKASSPSDGNGVVQYTELPDYAGLGNTVDPVVEITVPPVDGDGDGVFEYQGDTFYLNANESPGPEYTIVLDPSYNTNLRVRYSNVTGLETTSYLSVPGTIAPDDSIYVVFSLPVSPDNYLVRMLKEDMSETVATQVEVDGEVMTITFPDGLDAGAKYHLQIHVVSAVADQPSEGNFYAPVYTRTEDPVRIVSLQRDADNPNRRIVVTFNQPIGTGNPSLNTFSGSNCVIWFGFDIDATDVHPGTGDNPGEEGNDSCSVSGLSFQSLEKVPALPGGRRTGFSTVWVIQLPDSPNYEFVTNGDFTLKFSRLTDTSHLPVTPDGQVVPDQSAQLP